MTKDAGETMKTVGYWIKDDANMRERDGKTLAVTHKGECLGVCMMRLHQTDSAGNTKPGFVQLTIEPHDLNSSLHWEEILGRLDKTFSENP